MRQPRWRKHVGCPEKMNFMSIVKSRAKDASDSIIGGPCFIAAPSCDTNGMTLAAQYCLDRRVSQWGTGFLALVTDILDAQRFGRGKVKADANSVDLNIIVSSVSRKLQSLR